MSEWERGEQHESMFTIREADSHNPVMTIRLGWPYDGNEVHPGGGYDEVKAAVDAIIAFHNDREPSDAD